MREDTAKTELYGKKLATLCKVVAAVLWDTVLDKTEIDGRRISGCADQFNQHAGIQF
jgi:hypothetical protein